MRFILASAAAALTFAAAPAIADSNVVEVRVAVADLDLDSAEGRAALEQRIERQLRKACEVTDPLGRKAPKTDWNCVKSAKAAALAQIERNDTRADVAMAAE